MALILAVSSPLIFTGAKSDKDSEVSVAWRVAGPGGKLEQTLTTSRNEVFTNVLSQMSMTGDNMVTSVDAGYLHDIPRAGIQRVVKTVLGTYSTGDFSIGVRTVEQ